jgi:hypothetical protein
MVKSNRNRREYVPDQRVSHGWFSINWQEGSSIIDCYMKVQHSHADKMYSGKESKEEIHMMLSLNELIQLEESVRQAIITRLKP